jgi:glycosyltransferase involved in cell wall biosynthesis
MKKLRILHVIKGLGKAGAERLCLDICNELHKRTDIEVLLLSMTDVNAYPFLTETIPFQIIHSKVRPSISGKSIIDTKEYVDIVQEFKPDIIHSHLFRSELLTREIPFAGVKYITHCHDKMRELAPLSWKTLISKQQLVFYYERRWILKRYKHFDNTFLAISKDLEQYYLKVLPKQLRKTKVLHNAIDVNRFSKAYRDRSKDNDTLQLVNIGSFLPYKNQEFLVDVVEHLKNYNMNVHLTLIGDGEKRQFVQNKISRKNLGENISLIGITDKVEDYLEKSYLYVHASLVENFGLVLLEAMAAGLPVICLDGGGNRELIQDSKNGYIFKKQEAELFAERIASLWLNKQLYQEMSANAQQFAKQYDIKEYVDKLIDIYKELLVNQ